MTPYAETQIPSDEVFLFQMIRKAVINLPDFDFGKNSRTKEPIPLSCHMLSRAVADVYSLHSADGYYISTFQHSWNHTPSGHIIDCYPIGIIGGPILMDKRFRHAHNLYMEISPCPFQEIFENLHFYKCVEKIISELKQIATTP